ncbi:MAG: hypothetical protein IPP85_19175, partial [Propionivibrio sp.]|nr:hypothetical protein [Propionivibrio sp.]
MPTESPALPRCWSRAIGTHHTPDLKQDALATVIHLADRLGHRLMDKEGAGEQIPVPPIEDAAWAAVGLDDESAAVGPAAVV